MSKSLTRIEGTNIIKFYGNKVNADLLTITFFDEHVWITYIPALNLVSQGKTPEQAQQRIKEVVEIYFLDAIENNYLEDDIKHTKMPDKQFQKLLPETYAPLFHDWDEEPDQIWETI